MFFYCCISIVLQDIFDDIVSNCPIGARTPGWKGVMPSHMQDSEPEANTEHHADESVPPDNDNDSNASDEMKKPNTSMETTILLFLTSFSLTIMVADIFHILR